MKRTLDHDVPDAVAIASTRTNATSTMELVCALQKLEPAARQEHAGAIVAMITDDDWAVTAQAWTLSKRLGEAALTSCTGAIVDMLTHPDQRMRLSAVILFGRLEPDTLNLHAGTLIGLLNDSSRSVRYHATCLFSSEYKLDMLTPTLIASARNAITNLLDDENYRTRREAEYALVNLKKKLVEYYWATARAFVDKYRIRPYALFWHEDACKSLCAPGGKWAVRDRAAFEAEFSERCA